MPLPAEFVAMPSKAAFYHTGEAQHPDYNPKTYRRNPLPTEEKEVIAWDMEGISLSGVSKPQHPVLFGNSAERSRALFGRHLATKDMLELIVDTGERHPQAIHVGYAFKYDANMIIAGLAEKHIIRLWKTGRVSFQFDEQYRWSIHWVPGKMFTVTKRWGQKRNSRAKVSVTIYDFFSFFGTSFIKAMEQILGDELTEEDREVVAHGKKARGNQTWEDFPEIRHYWEREIVLMQRTFEKFRDVMCRAGFALREWYGPGALANFINATRGIRKHLIGVQTTSGHLPDPVHEASKVAFSGGRFELFRAGRVRGPVYSVDINSAYPHAMTKLPSFEKGEWVHTVAPKKVELFGVYRIKWKSPNASPFDFRPNPLFWRDNRGMISYPTLAHGWYWSPEAAIVNGMDGIEILEGWHWETESEERPWSFLQEMFNTRMRLGKKNLLSMPFKLGPNSLYGKYAQTVGWDQKEKRPPKSHALPVAGWVTSYCRAMLWDVIRRDPSSVIAVETDSVYTTRDPRTLGISIGGELGQWDITEYDEVIYMQSGMYHTKKDGAWTGVKSRGMSAAEFSITQMENYLMSLRCGEKWGNIELTTKPRFIGAGAALQMSAPLKTVHTSWRPQERKMALGDTGKRVHVPKVCMECASEKVPDSVPHRLIVSSRSDGETLSFPRRLPWEREEEYPEVQEIRDRLEFEKDLISV